VKKVLIITYYWPPAGGAGVQRWLKMSKYLAGFNVEPIILTVDPDGASYPVSDKSFLREVPDGIRVIRTKSFEPLQIYSRLFGKKNVPYSGFANVETDSFMSRLSRWVRGNFFIPDARKGWNKYAIQAAKDIIREEGIRTVITTGPPHSTHLIGLELKRNCTLNWIADFRDPWTDIYYYPQLLHTARVKKIDRDLEIKVLSDSDLVLTVCPSNQSLISEKLPMALRSKVKLLPNGFDTSDFGDIEAMTFDCFTMVYTGTMAATYDFPLLLAALSNLNINWKLIIAGSISPEVKKQIEEYGIEDQIDFRGYLPHAEVIKLLVSANLLIHVLPKHEKGTTGKLFEYIGSGKPILNIGRADGDSGFYIAEAKAGETFAHNDSNQIEQFIADVSSGKISFTSSRNSFTRKARAERLVELITSLD
jgi:glycosyltransferase involved in cell wall biosynthesis